MHDIPAIKFVEIDGKVLSNFQTIFAEFALKIL